MLALALQHKWACKASMQEVYRRFGRPPTDFVHDHFTHCLKSWCLCCSCCSARWFAKGLTNLLVSNVCYIVSWIRTDSKMHQNCTQLILMVRSYPKKKNNNNNNERKPVLTVIGIKKKNSEKMCIKLLTRASTLDMFCHIKIIWKLNEWVQFLFVSCFPVYKKQHWWISIRIWARLFKAGVR